MRRVTFPCLYPGLTLLALQNVKCVCRLGDVKLLVYFGMALGGFWYRNFTGMNIPWPLSFPLCASWIVASEKPFGSHTKRKQ